jgi:hypothetical protein
MASEVEIVNLALSHLGISKEIADLDTEKSDEARAGRRFYDICRDSTLRDFPWPFATKFLALGLISDELEDSVEDEWDFSYRYPTDCAKIIRIRSGMADDTRQSRVTYKIAQDATGRLIYTNEEDASLEYTRLEDNPERFTSDFVMALSFRIASMMAPRLTAGDPYKLATRAYQMYTIELERAKATAINEGQVSEDVESEFIRGRE